MNRALCSLALSVLLFGCPSSTRDGGTPTDGGVTNLCAAVTCQSGETCNKTNGKCETKTCDAACTNDVTKICDNGTCVSKCVNGQPTAATGNSPCTTGQVCDPNTGTCADACAVKMASSSKCAIDERCDSATASCVANVTPKPGEEGGACDGAATKCKDSKALCRTEAKNSVPGGACLKSCGNASCSPGFIPLGTGANCICVEACKTSAECRQENGWSCEPALFLGQGAKGPGCIWQDECLFAGKKEADCADEAQACDPTHPCKADLFCETFLASDKNGAKASGVCMRFVTPDDTNNPAFANDVCWPAACSSAACDGAGDDPTLSNCLPTCAVGDQTACKVAGYSCQSFTATQGVCLGRECDADADCAPQTVRCTATTTTNCGKGQTCSAAGTCSRWDACSKDADCGGGVCDTQKGFCKPSCEQANGLCFPSCTGKTGTTLATDCGSADATKFPRSCSSAGACQVKCVSDDACGASAVCEGGVCVSRCWKATVAAAGGKTTIVSNEATVCGSNVCNFSTGHCKPACSNSNPCSSTEICDASAHCIPKCTTDASCGTGNVCDTASGTCVAACNLANEATVCNPSGTVGTHYCDTNVGANNGHCYLSCSDTAGCATGEQCCTSGAHQAHCILASGTCN